MNSQQIIQKFIDTKYEPMANIKNNKIFYTENTASTLVWVEDNVVIEHYFLFPNLITPIHAHPFENQLIFIKGDMTAYRKVPIGISYNNLESGKIYETRFNKNRSHKLSSIMPIGVEHGFSTGPNGAEIYNIQIWPEKVTDPKSAAIEYLGEPMGPIHEKILKNFLSPENKTIGSSVHR